MYKIDRINLVYIMMARPNLYCCEVIAVVTTKQSLLIIALFSNIDLKYLIFPRANNGIDNNRKCR